MKNVPSTSNDRKVTLSCRLLPEQKLMLAEKAKEMNMSLAQYTEAKVLRKDILPLEKKIEKQRAEIESLKAKLFRMERDKNEELGQVKTKYKSKVKILEDQANEMTNKNASSLSIRFPNSEERDSFVGRMNLLRQKYQVNSNFSVLEMCLNYALENDKGSFFLKRVSEFYNDNYKFTS